MTFIYVLRNNMTGLIIRIQQIFLKKVTFMNMQIYVSIENVFFYINTSKLLKSTLKY